MERLEAIPHYNPLVTEKSLCHPEGYVQVKQDREQYDYQYVFQYKDHTSAPLNTGLGNIRLSYADLDDDGSIDLLREILEEKNYYPFGLHHKLYNNVVNGTENNYFTYNGKERNKELSLNWHDFGSRNYDSYLGCWMKVEPKAEVSTKKINVG